MAAGGLDQLTNAVAGAPASRDGGGVGHGTGARGLTVGLVLLPTTISHSCTLGNAVDKTHSKRCQKTHSCLG